LKEPELSQAFVIKDPIPANMLRLHETLRPEDLIEMAAYAPEAELRSDAQGSDWAADRFL
jgi:hypothetical protein